jgi:hypothetical protein
MQEVARKQIRSIQDQVTSTAFEMVAPKRTDITSWIAESWKELSSKTISSGFAKAGLLGDVRNGETEEEVDRVETITDLLDRLSDPLERCRERHRALGIPMRKEGCPVSSQMLRYKALKVAADEGLIPEVFKASHSWRRRIMRPHKLAIRARTRQDQTTLEDAAAAKAKFAGEVRAAIIEHGITTVYNADQTGT